MHGRLVKLVLMGDILLCIVYFYCSFFELSLRCVHIARERNRKERLLT